jgi:hypothetical protein
MLQSARERGDSTNLYVARKTSSQASGIFSFEGVPEGPHLVGVILPKQGPQPWTSKEIKVSVEGGQVREAVVRVGKGGVLEVTVVNAQTGRPLAGANLFAYGQGCKLSWSAIADARGVARVRVPAGTYTVSVSAHEFFKFSYWQGTARVTDGQVVREQVLLTPVPSVSGRVVGLNGQPVADVAVTVHPWGDHVHTDSQGRFVAGCEEALNVKGALVLASDAASGLAAAARLGDLSRPVELKLSPAWTLRAKIADPNGIGIPAARVSFDLSTFGYLSRSGVEVLTDREGRFQATGIPPVQSGFEYCICINVAGYGPQKYEKIHPSGEPGASVDLGAIRLPPANASVSGVVVNAAGVPAARIPVFVNSVLGLDQPHRKAITNEKGEFTINRLCPGPARLQARFASDPGGPGFLVTELPAHGVKVVLGKELTHTPATSILNKPLPSLTDLSAALSQVRTNSRPILVCFFDMNQRPSRNCLTELAKQAERLKEKGVTVVAAQASKVSANELAEWVKKNNIPFAVGMVHGDEGQALSTWGVRSLPWLILTDKKHVVVAEGFGIGDLENKLE